VRRDLTIRSVSLERKELKTRDRSVLGKFIFIRDRLVNKMVTGCTELDLNSSGKTPEARESLMIVVMVGRRAQVHFSAE
jgi:hypothetical protein